MHAKYFGRSIVLTKEVGHDILIHSIEYEQEMSNNCIRLIQTYYTTIKNWKGIVNLQCS